MTGRGADRQVEAVLDVLAPFSMLPRMLNDAQLRALAEETVTAIRAVACPSHAHGPACRRRTAGQDRIVFLLECLVIMAGFILSALIVIAAGIWWQR